MQEKLLDYFTPTVCDNITLTFRFKKNGTKRNDLFRSTETIPFRRNGTDAGLDETDGRFKNDSAGE